MSADDPVALDLDPIRARLAIAAEHDLTAKPAVCEEYYGNFSECGDFILVGSAREGATPPLAEFIAHAPADIAALLAEVERLRAELALAVAVCVDCGKVTRCDDDRCCLTCGRDLIILSDQHSADVLDASLEQLGNDFVKEWSDGRAE